MLRTKEAYQTDRKPIIAFFELRNRDRWPKAESTKCCMFEALELVGCALFGPEWSGEELHALDWPLQPKVPEAQRLHNMNTLAPINSGGGAKMGRTITIKELPFVQHVIDRNAHLYEFHRAQAVEAEQELWEANRKLADKLTAVVDWIASKCRDGELVSFCRFLSGGQLMAIEAHEWNIESPIARFLAKGCYSRWFLRPEPVKQWDVYLFFDRANLQQVVTNLAHAPVMVPVCEIDRLSPYLKLAIKLAITKGYVSEVHDETQPIREAEVKAAWNDALPGIPWSETAGQAIAKVMGFPNASAIQQGRRARSAGK